MLPADTPHLTLLGLLFILMACLLVLVLPRRIASIPLILTACYITIGQQVVIFGFNFTALRLVILVGWIRLFARGELRALEFNLIDKVFLWWLVVGFIANTILWQSSEALVGRLGLTYNAAGLYFLFRCLVRDLSEIEALIKISAIIVLPLALIMAFEAFSGRNIFSIFGGVPAISDVRGGYVRAQGPFRFAGLAGAAVTALMPLFAALWFNARAKFSSVVGLVAATSITIACHSGGPLLSYCAGIVALIMWPFHKSMRTVRYIILFGLIALAAVIKAPIWFLIGRLSAIVGGTGYHRSAIIDAAVRHFDEWWLIGTKETGHWMPYFFAGAAYGFDRADMTNQYIAQGVNGGLATMILFIGIIVLCFREIGLSLRVNEDEPFSRQIMIWALGASLLVHVVSFFSVTYFDQTIVFWYLLLAMISSLGMKRQQTA